ncbi:MAG: glycosylase/AP lyase, DNA-binding [Clostridia bacterium]|nr:glycosylase/AP lyase, DNA-binding [Clostridia bacterium]
MSFAENHVISNQLKETVVGKKIVKATVNQNPHTFVWFAMSPSQAFTCHPEGYEEFLTGKTIDKSDANFGGYGVYNFLYIGNRALMFNIPTRYHKKGDILPKRHQLLLELDDGSAISFTGSLGGPIFLFEVNEKGQPINYSNVNFPSVLSDEFSLDFFLKLIKNTELRSLSAKAFLATKNRIPGLDNVILHEILWEAEVNPKSKMVALTEKDFIRIFEAIKKVFPAVIAQGGRDTEKDLFGNDGGYITRASKNTLGKPCTRCGENIIKESYLGGAVYYCPGCQVFHDKK